MKPITRYTLATLALLFASCGQEEGTDTPAAGTAGEQAAATQPETPTPAEATTPSADTPATPEPEPAPEPEPEPTPEERYNNGADAPSDPVAAIDWYTEYAEAGIVDASYKLGMSYYAARSVPMNFVKAVEHLRTAAEQGHREAAIKLAECYEWGVGVEADPAEAAKWRPEGVPAPEPVGEPTGEAAPTAEPTPGPESADPEESDPEPTPSPESADPEESDPEPTPGPESADPEESDPEPAPAVGGDLAPADLTGCTVALNYESSQYKYEEDGEDQSGWQSFQNAKKNKNGCAEAFIAFDLKPKATRNLVPISTPAKGGKYVYRKTGANTGVLTVGTGGADRTYTITFDSPTTGTAVEEVMGGSMMGYCRNIVVNISGGAAAATPGPESADPEESDPEPTSAVGGDLAPADLTGKTLALNYESSQYKYAEDGEDQSGWQSFQNAKKNKNGCAEAFIAFDLKPKATRNLVPISTPAKGGKYVYRKTGTNTGVLTVGTGGADRTYTITFDSPTTGTAVEEVMGGSMMGYCRNIRVTIK